MATITATVIDNGGVPAKTLTETTLTGTLDTFTYYPGFKQTLILRNPTAGALSPIIDGSAATTVAVTGVGSVDVSSGYAVGSIAAGAAKVIRLQDISSYLGGTIAITGGTGLVATLTQG